MHLNYALELFAKNQTQSQKLAIVDDHQSLTYQQLEQRARSFATQLKQSGLLPQSRIVLYFDDSVEWVVAFLGSLLAGLNPVCFNHGNSNQQLATLLDLVNGQAVISDLKVELNPTVKFFHKNQIFENYTEISDNNCYMYHYDEPCFWLCTSGTTGHPKVIVHRQGNLFNNYQVVSKEVWHIDKHSVVFTTAKLSFAWGFYITFCNSLLYGATVHVMKGLPAPTKVFEYVNSRKITNLFSVPTVINSLVKHKKDRKFNSNLVYVVSSGEILSSSLSTTFYQLFGIKIRNSLGMSELFVSFAQTFNNYEEGAIGIPITGVEVKLLDENLNPVDIGKIGEVWIKSDTLAAGYWKDYKYTREKFVGEWYRSGDKLVKTHSGNYYYVSRIEDLITISGHDVSLGEVESVLSDLPEIEELAVVFKNSPMSLIEIHAFVVVANALVDKDSLLKTLTEKLSCYKISKKIHFVESIPKTLTNKKKRHELLQQLNSY
jgi:benzoate-CoA ligase